MTTPNQLLALAARVEAGSGEDRELRTEIAVALKWTYASFNNAWSDDLGTRRTLAHPPAWENSLDAVIALIEERLPGWTWKIERVWTPDHGYFWLVDGDPPEAGPSPEQVSHAEECRARLIIALAALAQQSRPTEQEDRHDGG